MRKVLILGGAGFMGRALVAYLTSRNFAVTAPTSSEVSLDDTSSLLGVMERTQPTAIINLAAISSVTHADARALYETNGFGHRRVLEAALEMVPNARVLLASSANIYGQSRTFRESDAPAPLNDYAIAKTLAESFNRLFADRLSVTAARPFNCIGRGQRPDFVIAKVVDAFRRRAPRLELGDLAVERDYVDIRDVCAMWETLLTSQSPPPVVNFGTGVATNLSDVIAMLERISGHKMEVISTAHHLRPRDIRYQCADTDLLESLGAKAQRQLTETLAWMMSAEGEE